MENHLKAASVIANLLDNQFEIFGRRFGLNGLIGLIPEVGDIIVLVFSMYIVWIGVAMGLPVNKIAQMIWNVLIDFFIGLVPVVGDYFDFFRKANMKNLNILHQYSREHKIIEGVVVS